MSYEGTQPYEIKKENEYPSHELVGDSLHGPLRIVKEDSKILEEKIGVLKQKIHDELNPKVVEPFQPRLQPINHNQFVSEKKNYTQKTFLQKTAVAAAFIGGLFAPKEGMGQKGHAKKDITKTYTDPALFQDASKRYEDSMKGYKATEEKLDHITKTHTTSSGTPLLNTVSEKITNDELVKNSSQAQFDHMVVDGIAPVNILKFKRQTGDPYYVGNYKKPGVMPVFQALKRKITGIITPVKKDTIAFSVPEQTIPSEPIYVDNKNDQRYKAYKDSLSLYNTGNENEYKNKLDSAIKTLGPFTLTKEKDSEYFTPKDKGSLEENYLQVHTHYKSGDKAAKQQHEPTFSEFTKNGIEPTKVFHMRKWDSAILNKYYPIYKKPLQEVILNAPRGRWGDPVYHPNGDLMGFMKEGAFQKLQDVSSIKPETKDLLASDAAVDAYFTQRLGGYYKGVKKD